MAGVSSDFSLTMALLLVCACLAAHSPHTVFAPVWHGALPGVAEQCAGVVFGRGGIFAGHAADQPGDGGNGPASLPHDAGPLYPTAYTDALPTGAALLGHTLRESLEGLPQQLLWLLEWTSLFYLLACCLRRRRGLTLAVVLGVPFVCVMLMLMPFVRETAVILESGTETEIMAMGLEWMQWLARVAQFVVEQWQWIQLGAAAVSLPLSYLCMRTTPQP